MVYARFEWSHERPVRKSLRDGYLHDLCVSVCCLIPDGWWAFRTPTPSFRSSSRLAFLSVRRRLLCTPGMANAAVVKSIVAHYPIVRENPSCLVRLHNIGRSWRIWQRFTLPAFLWLWAENEHAVFAMKCLGSCAPPACLLRITCQVISSSWRMALWFSCRNH